MKQNSGVCISMNNQEKNSYVRAQLTSALLEMMEQMPLNEISVSALTKRAQVGRVSFYRNFDSVEDILFQHDKSLLREWTRAFEADPASGPHNVFGSLFAHYRAHAKFYTLLYKNGLTQSMLETIKQHVGLTPELGNKDAYAKAFFAYGVYGWLLEWIARGMTESAAEINSMLAGS